MGLTGTVPAGEDTEQGVIEVTHGEDWGDIGEVCVVYSHLEKVNEKLERLFVWTPPVYQKPSQVKHYTNPLATTYLNQ